MKKTPAKRSWFSSVGKEAARATTLGWDLALPIFGGVLLGAFLDRRLGTGYIFTLGLLFAGAGLGFFNLWRFEQELEAEERERKAARAKESSDEEPL